MSDGAQLLGALARVLAKEPDSLPLCERMCRACAAVLEADGAAITLVPASPERVVLCATDPIAARIEDVQEVVAQGPTQHAFTHNQAAEYVVDGSEGGSEGQWDRFAESVHELLGPVTVRAVPIRPGRRNPDAVLGVLMLYRRGARPMDRQADAIQTLADAVGAALIRDPEGLDHPAGLDDNVGPWSRRAWIHQATGMLVAQLRLTPPDALVLMRAHAYAHDQSLDEVAGLILSRELDFARIDPDDPSDDRRGEG
jgi:hypothetical protein